MNATRRQFLRPPSLAASGFAIAPPSLFGQPGGKPPGQKLRIAGVGVGGMGGNNLKQCAAEDIVALCDVDQSYAARTFQEFPAATVYRDYREMLEKQKDIDAVIIATPEHTHAVIAMKESKHQR